MAHTNYLAQERKFRGCSVDEVAKMCNVTRYTVMNWESGKSSPSLDKLRILEENGFDVWFIYKGERSKTDLNFNFSNHLDALITRKGWYHTQLVKALKKQGIDVSELQINEWIKGESVPDDAQIKVLASIFNTTEAYICFGRHEITAEQLADLTDHMLKEMEEIRKQAEVVRRHYERHMQEYEKHMQRLQRLEMYTRKLVSISGGSQD